MTSSVFSLTIEELPAQNDLEFLQTLPGEGRDGIALQSQTRQSFLDFSYIPVLRGVKVYLVEHHHLLFCSHVHMVILQLLSHHKKILQKGSIRRIAYVHHVKEEPGSLNVLEEAVPQSLPLARPFDQTRDVGYREF